MAKYGDLVHIFVDKHSAGHVYMMFKTTEQGGKAANVLHGRFFAQRRLTCEFIPTVSGGEVLGRCLVVTLDLRVFVCVPVQVLAKVP